MKEFVKKLGLSLVSFAVMAALFIVPAKAATPYTITPFTFVGVAGDCGTGYPAGTADGVVSKWDYFTGNSSPSLLLAKISPTTDCSAAGANINGVMGIKLNKLGFDVYGYCGAGAPRFNVVTEDNVTHFIGCSSGIQKDLGTGWTYVLFDPTDPTQAFPVIAPGTRVNNIQLIQDEHGATNLDNIIINDQIIGNPNVPNNKELCNKFGWQSLQDLNGQTFKNQGQCVSFSVSNEKSGR